jgi:hypothetical protein
MLRDQALADSGLLVEKIGGPSVKPYQPPGLWEEIAMGKPHYDQGHGADLYADRSYCTARRQSTSTPLQALALLNDTQIAEAARFAGERMFREGGSTTDARLAYLFRLITSREPRPPESAILAQLYQEQLALFDRDPDAAAKLLEVGEAKLDTTLPKDQLAAAAVVAQALFNHDEAIMRR